MTVQSLLARLRELSEAFPRENCPWEYRPRFEPGISAEIIQSIEQNLGAPLPQDVSEFFRNCNTIVAMDIWNGYWIGDLPRLTSESFRAYFPKTIEGPTGPESIIPIATDGGGNAFVLSLRNGHVRFWNHETGALSVVASSFTHFLERVVADWEHAIKDDGNWKYLV
jgi:cell wall assembly regulator SMI1